MKTIITIALLCSTMLLQAQNRKQMRQRQADSLTQSKSVAATEATPANGMQPTSMPKRQHKPINGNRPMQATTTTSGVKLDDLKNPFDTAKTVSKAPVNAAGNEAGRRRKKNQSGSGATDGPTSQTALPLSNAKTVTTLQPATAQPIQAMVTVFKSYNSKNGNVDIAFEKSKKPKDAVRTKTEAVKDAMCLTKEEVRGQKIENEVIIADGSKAVQILPGAVIDATVLLNSGDFKFMNMTKRKSITLTTTSNLAIKVSQTATARNNNDITDELRTKTHALTSPANLRGMPNMSSSSEAKISTLHESTGMNIGASFFYMGIKATNNFNFSSEKYHYMYMYTFEQACLPVIANGITSPDDIFTEPTPMNNNWLYVQEVKYGRRLYVLMESEYDLEKYSNELGGKVSWGVVSAKLSADVKGSKLTNDVNIRVYTQGGQPLAITDESQLQREIDKYFQTSFKSMDIVPLSFKLTYMDGQLASLVSNAYLDGKNCLDATKAKVRLKSIECKQADDSKKNEEIYGSAKINMYNTENIVMLSNGITPAPPSIPTGTISFGSKDVPINLAEGKSKVYDVNEQGKYIEMLISNLDTKFEILPFVHEKDNGFNGDDDYTTENRLKKTLRQMLMEGTTSQTFEFRRKGSVLLLNFEIIPL